MSAGSGPGSWLRGRTAPCTTGFTRTIIWDPQPPLLADVVFRIPGEKDVRPAKEVTLMEAMAAFFRGINLGQTTLRCASALRRDLETPLRHSKLS
jgi:hypothetical protein